jgi:hypothetical protein
MAMYFALCALVPCLVVPPTMMLSVVIAFLVALRVTVVVLHLTIAHYAA